GWLPDGRLLVVSMTDRRLLRLDPGGLTVAADLAALASFHCNDMVVDARGRAYVGNFGFDLHAAAPFHAAELVLVPPGAAPRVVGRKRGASGAGWRHRRRPRPRFHGALRVHAGRRGSPDALRRDRRDPPAGDREGQAERTDRDRDRGRAGRRPALTCGAP